MNVMYVRCKIHTIHEYIAAYLLTGLDPETSAKLVTSAAELRKLY